jgi:hypothetical protein
MARKPLAKTVARGYGQEHRRKVARERPQMLGKPCVRCGYPLYEPMQLDHTDDRTGYLGWSHQTCNVRASNRRRAAIRRAQGFVPRRRRVYATSEPAPEVEPGVWVLSQGRQHSRGW